MRWSRVEKEAFGKSFLLFFLSITLLLAALFYSMWLREKSHYDQVLFSQMRLCSFELKCPQFTISFDPFDKKRLYTLLRDDRAVYADFPIPGSQKFALKIAYPLSRYQTDLDSRAKKLVWMFVAVEGIAALLAVLFSLYALWPLRKALKLTEEFVKDILHDFNTPISIIRLNVGMLKQQCPQSRKIERIEKGIETIVRLQSNLRRYLGGHTLQNETIALDRLVKERAATIFKDQEDIRLVMDLAPVKISANRDAVIRIVDNLLSNALRYNRKGGEVRIVLDEKGRLQIADTGVGIRRPERIFERFYKEHDRGLGIGLHIVKKLCDEMDVTISVESRLGEGSRFILDFSKRLG